jgi:protein-disulfide isomerase
LPTVEQVLETYPGKVKLVFKEFPLRNHRYARKAAAAALAADQQSKFWEYQQELFKNSNQLSDQKIQEIARQLGLDEERFRKDMNDPKIAAKINKDMEDANKAGVRGTPTISVNGRLLRQRNLEGFQAIIEKELEKTAKKHE